MPQVSKIVMATLAAAISVGAALPASAWGYTKCKVWSDMDVGTVSNQMVSKNCHAFIVGEGMVSRDAWGGDIKDKGFTGYGTSWEDAFPDAHYKAPDADNVYLESQGNKYVLRVGDHDSLRTKRLDEKDIDNYLHKIGYHKVVKENTLNPYGQRVKTWTLKKDK